MCLKSELSPILWMGILQSAIRNWSVLLGKNTGKAFLTIRMMNLNSSLKQAMLIRRIDTCLSQNIDEIECLPEFCQDVMFATDVLGFDPSLKSPEIRQMLVSLSVVERLNKKREQLFVKLAKKVDQIFMAKRANFIKVAAYEEVFLSYSNLNAVDVLEKDSTESFVKVLAKTVTAGRPLPEVLQSLTNAFGSEAGWIFEAQEFAADSRIQAMLSSILAATLLKCVFSKADSEYFPPAKLEVFADNFQLYERFLERQFKKTGLPKKLQTDLKNKQNMLYKAHLISVIKGLEKNLIRISKFLETSKSVEQFEQECVSKCKSNLKTLIEELILSNTTKDTITTSLLDKVFALGLRTIARVEAFFEESLVKTTDKSLLFYLTEKMVQIADSIEPRLMGNIEELGAKLGLSESAIKDTQSLFGKRIAALKSSGIGQNFYLVAGGSLKLDDEVSGIALKLSMQLFNRPSSASHIVNSVQNQMSKYTMTSRFGGVSAVAIQHSVVQFMLAKLAQVYDKQASEALRTYELNRDHAAKSGKGVGRVWSEVQRAVRTFCTSCWRCRRSWTWRSCGTCRCKE